MKAFADMTPAELKAEKHAFAVRIGERLKQARLKAGLTQEQLAAQAGYHPTYIGNVETAKHLPTSHTVWRLATAMGVDVGQIFKGL